MKMTEDLEKGAEQVAAGRSYEMYYVGVKDAKEAKKLYNRYLLIQIEENNGELLNTLWKNTRLFAHHTLSEQKIFVFTLPMTSAISYAEIVASK